jgi:hypothetical protein
MRSNRRAKKALTWMVPVFSCSRIKLSNQIRAQEEKDADAKASRSLDVPEVRVHSGEGKMMDEDHREGGEAQHIKLRPVEAAP